MLCDVCNDRIPDDGGTRIGAEVFALLLENDFGIDEYNIRMLTDARAPRQEAVAMLKQQSFSLPLTGCFAIHVRLKPKPNLTPKRIARSQQQSSGRQPPDARTVGRT